MAQLHFFSVFSVVIRALFSLLLFAGNVSAESLRDVEKLNAEFAEFYQAGNFADAKEIALRSLKIRERLLGPKHPEVATWLNNLALLEHLLGNYSSSEKFFLQSLRILEKAFGDDHLQVANTLKGLAAVYLTQSRYREAEALFKRSLRILESVAGSDHPVVATALAGLGQLYMDQGRLDEAEPALSRSLRILEESLGPMHIITSAALKNLSTLLRIQGQYDESEKLLNRCLAIREKELGANHVDIAEALLELAGVHRDQSRLSEAESLSKRSLEIYERVLGADHTSVATSLNRLATLYQDLGRHIESEALHKRSITIYEKALGVEHPYAVTSINNLALFYLDRGRNKEAEALLRRVISIREKVLGADHPDLIISLNNLAGAVQHLGRFKEAEELFKRAVVASERAWGAQHPTLAMVSSNLAGLYLDQNRGAEAEPLLERSLAIRQRTLGPDHIDIAVSLNALARIALSGQNWSEAVFRWKSSTRIIQFRANRGNLREDELASGGEVQKKISQFDGLIKATYRVVANRLEKPVLVASETFESAQWGRWSDAAKSLSQMALRSTTGSFALSRLIRERQDLIAEWSAKDLLLIRSKSQIPEQRNQASERILRDRLTAIDILIASIDTRLASEFPDYEALTSARPIAANVTQHVLREDEALVFFLDTGNGFKPLPEETFVWVVTKTDVRWARSELGTGALTELVQALRCGLDEEEWSTPTKAAKCGEQLGTGELPSASSPLPFDLAKAHHLYRSLFGEVEDLIGGKRLLIVPSGPLTTLPFHALVTKPPAEARPRTFDGYRNVAWLAREHAITILPAVSSLKALRGISSQRLRAELDYAGYGNPVLEGDNTTCRSMKVPEACPSPGSVVADAGERATVRGRGSRRNAGIGALASRGGNVAETLTKVRALCPLPDTAYEIKCTARGFSQVSSLIRLDQQATEADLKAENEAGNLARYRVVHFATHGLLSSDVAEMRLGAAEPALVLTPPSGTPKDAEDDGLLTASEVAGLKLNADWVVLSACNTAASDGSGTEALSGLAKAFIYAGARALLVSHWPVYSDAAVRLTTSAFGKLERDPSIGRSEAMRQAMVELIDDTSQVDNAHPAVWAPFIVVGEGGQ